jgi:hypothetical protein
VPGHCTEYGATGRRGREQPTTDCGEREQRHDEPGGKANTTAEHAANPGWRFMLLGDAYFSVFSLFDHRGVVGVQHAGLVV